MVQRRYVHPWQQWVDANGNPGLGWKLYFYQTGTSTPLAVYANEGLSVPLDNPVIAEDDGGSSSGGVWPVIFLQSATYKVVLKDADDVTILTQDPYDPAAGTVPTSAVIPFTIVVKAGADGGDPLTTGNVDDIYPKFAFTITGWSVFGDTSGSITWDIYKHTYTQSDPPDSGEKITASAPPNLTSDQSDTSTTLTGWTTSVGATDHIRFVLTAVDGVLTRSTLNLHCTRTITLS